jgi:type IV fimbrial biogenesis protein FimT
MSALQHSRLLSRPLVKPHGFSLIELLVVMAIMGLLFGLGFPGFMGWIRNSQVRTVAESLQNGLSLAQTESVRRNQSVVFSFTNDANPGLNPTTNANGKNWSLQTIASAFVKNSAGVEGAAEHIKSGAFADVASNVTLTTPVEGAICFNANGRLLVDAAPMAAPASGTCTNAAAAVFDVSQSGADRPLRVMVQVGGQVRLCDPNRPMLSANSPDGCPP